MLLLLSNSNYVRCDDDVKIQRALFQEYFCCWCPTVTLRGRDVVSSALPDKVNLLSMFGRDV